MERHLQWVLLYKPVLLASPIEVGVCVCVCEREREREREREMGGGGGDHKNLSNCNAT